MRNKVLLLVLGTLMMGMITVPAIADQADWDTLPTLSFEDGQLTMTYALATGIDMTSIVIYCFGHNGTGYVYGDDDLGTFAGVNNETPVYLDSWFGSVDPVSPATAIPIGTPGDGVENITDPAWDITADFTNATSALYFLCVVTGLYDTGSGDEGFMAFISFDVVNEISITLLSELERNIYDWARTYLPFILGLIIGTSIAVGYYRFRWIPRHRALASYKVANGSCPNKT